MCVCVCVCMCVCVCVHVHYLLSKCEWSTHTSICVFERVQVYEFRYVGTDMVVECLQCRAMQANTIVYATFYTNCTSQYTMLY